MAKKEQIAKFKKAPLAPRRFKSAYMFFSTEKHKSIRQEHHEKLQTTDVAKMVSQAWKDLSSKEREAW
jgi:HMG-box domain